MTDFNIFYDSSKNINWASSGPVTSQVISDQAKLCLTHVQLSLAQMPACDKYYVNDAGDGVVAYHTFALNFSATTIAVDATITITGCPAGTEIFLDGVSAGTYSTGSLTLTGSMSGTFNLTFKKDKYYDAYQQIIVSRKT